MAFGKIKADAIIRDNSGTEEEVTMASLVAKAGTASPTFTGTPEAPTATAGTNTEQIATTEFVTTAANARASTAANTFTEAQSVQVEDATGSSVDTLDLSDSNFVKVAGNDYDQDPTLPPVGTSGLFYVDTAAPTGWHNDFKFPTGGYVAPTAFPAIAPWYVAETDEVLVGSFTEGISDVSGN